MHRIITLLTTILSTLALHAQVDSSYILLQSKLEEYCKVLDMENDSLICNECDFLIETCQESGSRDFTANWLYQHYYKSRRMGAEGIAIHIFDKWFDKGPAKMPDELSHLTASIFAQFNRQSLLGCRALQLELKDEKGQTVKLFGGKPERPAVLYFYSTDCAKCRVENIMVSNVLENRDCPLDVYAVCTSADTLSWEKHRNGRLNMSLSNGRVWHMWDPERNMDWQMKYGILETPKMFLINTDGIIIGRKLDSFALDQMLEEMFRHLDMKYGEDESKVFYDTVFDAYREEKGYLSAENLNAVASHIAQRTLAEEKDTLLFKQMTGDLLYYINGSGDPGIKAGSSEFIEKQIYSRTDIWNTHDDSLKITGLAMIMKDLLDRSPVGSTLPDISVSASIADRKSEKSKKAVNLAKLNKSVNYIMFYSPACKDCRRELESLDRIFSAEKKLNKEKKLSKEKKLKDAKGLKSKEYTKVLKVNLDSIEGSDTETFGKLIQHFDLSVIPLIIKVRNGKVEEKYCSFTTAS